MGCGLEKELRAKVLVDGRTGRGKATGGFGMSGAGGCDRWAGCGGELRGAGPGRGFGQ